MLRSSRFSIPAVVAAVAVVAAAVAVARDPACSADPLADEKVRQFIEKARASRTDLPAAPLHSNWVIHRETCHYVAVESEVPATPEANSTFVLNQRGVLVDAEISNTGRSDMKCPGAPLSNEDLKKILAQPRARRPDLPPTPSGSRTSFSRRGCTYKIFEFRIPGSRGDTQVFSIDSLGEFMSFVRF